MWSGAHSSPPPSGQGLVVVGLGVVVVVLGRVVVVPKRLKGRLSGGRVNNGGNWVVGVGMVAAGAVSTYSSGVAGAISVGIRREPGATSPARGAGLAKSAGGLSFRASPMNAF